MNFDLANRTAILERTPTVLRTLLAGLSEEWTHRNEGPDTWSPFDIVGHLIDGEETDWMMRARIILAQGTNRRFVPFDRFRHLRMNEGRTLGELLDRFAELRARNLQELEGLKLTGTSCSSRASTRNSALLHSSSCWRHGLRTTSDILPRLPA